MTRYRLVPRYLNAFFSARTNPVNPWKPRLDAWLLGRSGSEANIVKDRFAFVTAWIPDLELRLEIHRTRVYPWREGE